MLPSQMGVNVPGRDRLGIENSAGVGVENAVHRLVVARGETFLEAETDIVEVALFQCRSPPKPVKNLFPVETDQGDNRATGGAGQGCLNSSPIMNILLSGKDEQFLVAKAVG